MLTVDIKIKPQMTSISRLAMRLGLMQGEVYEIVAKEPSLEQTYLKLLATHTPVATGKARASWVIKSRLKHAILFQNLAVSPTGYPYPEVLEHGEPVFGREKAGPRTVIAPNERGEMRLYSRQAPGGISRPALRALNVAPVLKNVVKTMKSRLFG